MEDLKETFFAVGSDKGNGYGSGYDYCNASEYGGGYGDDSYGSYGDHFSNGDGYGYGDFNHNGYGDGSYTNFSPGNGLVDTISKRR